MFEKLVATTKEHCLAFCKHQQTNVL